MYVGISQVHMADNSVPLSQKWVNMLLALAHMYLI